MDCTATLELNLAAKRLEKEEQHDCSNDYNRHEQFRIVFHLASSFDAETIVPAMRFVSTMKQNPLCIIRSKHERGGGQLSDSPDINNECDDELRLVEKQIELEEAKKATLDAAHRNAKQAERKERRDEGKERRKTAAGMSVKSKLLALAVIIIAIVVIGGLAIPSMLPKHENRYYADSDLEKVVNIEKLSTVEYVYHGIVEKRGMFDMVDYWVKYEAHVDVSFKMSDIKIHIDNDAQTIDVTLPEPTIEDPVLNENEFGYLPERALGELPDVISMCQEDAIKEIEADGEVRDKAYKSLESTVRALTQPLLTGNYTYIWRDTEGNLLEGADEDVQ